MSRDKIEKSTFEYMKSGFNCAESVLKATMESRVETVDPNLPKVASAMGGGIGGTHENVCGALSGGVLAIGLLHGRTEPGVDVQYAKDLATKLRAKFVEKYGTTRCADLLESFGEQVDSHECRKMAAVTAGMLADILDEPME